MTIAEKIANDCGEAWIPEIYASKVRSQRTRSYSLDLPERLNRVDILHTLLGIEIKAANRRIASPDYSTARYIRTFARLGCREFAIPYDISRISTIADELEAAWHRTMLLINEHMKGKSVQAVGRARGAVIRAMRTEIYEAGAGPKMPKFDRPTKQRK